jgi:phosphoribosylamine--glycine ligase
VNVLVVDNGGRGHALAWKINQSPELEQLYVAEGNAGTSELAENVPIPYTEPDKLTSFAV